MHGAPIMTERITIPLLATALHPCAYLSDREARLVFLAPSPASDPEPLYPALLAAGFRRSGPDLYRPDCPSCSACTPIRIPVRDFVPDRQQRRTLKINQDVVIRILDAVVNEAHFALYQRYLWARHPEDAEKNSDEDDYRQFLQSGWSSGSRLIELSLGDGTLLAVALVDMTGSALSAVYTWYDPGMAARSPGTLSVLLQIRLAAEWGLTWLYLGYWISTCRKMAYKCRFAPAEVMRDGLWMALKPEDG